jgi:DNA-directed RNA polymerase omega subunit
MRDIAIDELVAKTGSVFKLVVLAARRALELSDNNSAKLVEAPLSAKPQDISLQEILEGKISYKTREKK